MPTPEAGKKTNTKKWLIKQAKSGNTDQERVKSERTMLYVSTKKTFENSKIISYAAVMLYQFFQ